MVVCDFPASLKLLIAINKYFHFCKLIISDLNEPKRLNNSIYFSKKKANRSNYVDIHPQLSITMSSVRNGKYKTFYKYTSDNKEL